MKTILSLNKKATVQKTVTPANRKLNKSARVQTNPTPTNRKMNAPARVKPKNY